jgi:thioredoxin 1
MLSVRMRYYQTTMTTVRQVLKNQKQLTHIKVYDGKGKKLGRFFQVKLWPTLILFHDGQEVARLVRPLHADLLHRLLTNVN